MKPIELVELQRGCHHCVSQPSMGHIGTDARMLCARRLDFNLLACVIGHWGNNLSFAHQTFADIYMYFITAIHKTQLF